MSDWPRPTSDARAAWSAWSAGVTWVALALAAWSGLAFAAEGGVVADSLTRARCEGLPIRRVEVRTRAIFDPLPKGLLRPVYATANRLHVRTRPEVVRSQQLLEPGQSWSADRVRESERLLRDLEYIEPEAIRSRRVRDSVDVLVVTRDQWTTQPEVNLERGGGRTYGAVGFTERNLLGLGVGLSFAFRDEPTGHTRTGSIGGRRLFGTRLEGQVGAGTGEGGVSNSFSLSQPFHSLADTASWGLSLRRSDADVMLFDRGSLAARVPLRSDHGTIEYGRGRRDSDGWVRRTSIALSRHDRHRGVTRHETGADPRRFAGGEEDLDLRTLSVRALWWRPLFLERRGVEQFDTVEDFDIGPRLGLEAGYTSTLLGSTADEGLFRLSAGVGVETRRFGFGLASARVSTRTRRDLREAVAHFDARWVQQPGRDLSVVTAAHGAVVERGPRETQFVLGGLDGLRAYPVQALNGTQVWRFNTEVRGVARRDVFNLVTVGGAVFHDAARAWGEGSAAGPWHHDAGFGLRLSFPHASLHQVARFDVAFPLSPTRDGRREPVFSFGSSQAF